MKTTPALPLVLLVAGSSLGACREITPVRPATDLAADPGAYTVAPRETITLSVRGGIEPYTFAFAEGSPLSGLDATIDPQTGVYQAGRRGSAGDVVTVTDDAGDAVEVRISVGAPLALTPGVVLVAPGGSVELTASGGKPPYAFMVADNRSGAQIVASNATATYTAGTSDLVVDRVAVADATADLAAVAVSEVQVGAGLILINLASGTVAPHGTAELFAAGGQPPYQFGLVTDGSGGATVDPVTGIYGAGPRGSVTDTVEVLDDNGIAARLDIPVGAELTIGLDPFDPRVEVAPGETVRLLAAGGLPPYTFRFGPRGNRSGGEIDPLTGDYTAGLGVGSFDELQVVDATSLAVATLTPALQVGPVRLEVGRATSCDAGDVTGDGAADGVLIDGVAQDLITIISTPAGTMSTHTAAVGAGTAEGLVLIDIDGTGDRRDVVWSASSELWTMFSLPGGIWGAERLLVDWGGPARSFAQWGTTFYVPGSPALCPNEVVQLAVDEAGQTSNVLCLGVPAIGTTSLAASGSTLLTAHSGETTVQTYDTTDTPPLMATTTALPAGHTVPARRLGERTIAQAMGGFFVLITQVAGGRSVVRYLPPSTMEPIGVEWPAPPGVHWSIEPLDFRRVLLARSDSGELEVLTWSAPGVSSVTAATDGPRPYGIGCVAAADFDRDGFGDVLLVSGQRSVSEVLYGDGYSSYNRRWRISNVGAFGVADADGDGISDLVLQTTTPGLQVWYGAGGQFAAGRERVIPAPLAPANITAQVHARLTFGGITLGDIDQAVTVSVDPSPFVVSDPAASGELGVAYRLGSGEVHASTQIGEAPFTPPSPLVGASGPHRLHGLTTFSGARFGGVTPGPDLLWSGAEVSIDIELDVIDGDVRGQTIWSSSMGALVRSGGYAADDIALSDMPTALCVPMPVDLQGDGTDDLARICLNQPQYTGTGGTNPTLTITLSVIAQVADGDASGGTYGIGSWTTHPMGTAVVHADLSHMDALPWVRPVGAWDGRAHFFVQGVPSAGDSRLWAVDAAGVRETFLGFSPTCSAWGWIDADPHIDVAGCSSSQIRILHGDGAGGFSIGPIISAAATELALTYPEPGQPADILALVGSSLLLLENDGAGNFP